MNFLTMAKKGFLGLMTFVTAYLFSNPDVITGFIPEKISNMTIGGISTAVIVMITNWLKNKSK